MPVNVGEVLEGGVVVRSSLNWSRVIGQMQNPPVETLTERAVRHVMDLHGLVQIAQRIQQEAQETSGVVRGDGMEEDLMEGSLDSSGAQPSDGEDEEGESSNDPHAPGFFE